MVGVIKFLRVKINSQFLGVMWDDGKQDLIWYLCDNY